MIPEGTIMVGDNKKSWMELCELAVQEKDPTKLMALIEEIDRLLESKEQSVRKPPSSVRISTFRPSRPPSVCSESLSMPSQAGNSHRPGLFIFLYSCSVIGTLSITR